MNRINQMIDLYATNAATALIRANECVRAGFLEEGRGYADDMVVARHELTQWIKISQAVRGWQL